MAITTMDGLVAGLSAHNALPYIKANVTAVAGRLTSTWTAAGQPGAGSTTLGQSASGVVPTSADVGAIPFTNPVTGNSYLAKISGNVGADGVIYVYDVLWIWGSGGSGWSVTTTTAQNTSSPAALTRPSATGDNVEAFFQVLATMGAGAATPTLSYTNTAGTSGRTTGASGYAASSIIGSVYNLPLQAGDNGINTVQSLTLTTSMTSGTARIILARRLCEIPCVANRGFLFDFAATGLTQVYNDACIMPLFLPQSTASGPVNLSLKLAQG